MPSGGRSRRDLRADGLARLTAAGVEAPSADVDMLLGQALVIEERRDGELEGDGALEGCVRVTVDSSGRFTATLGAGTALTLHVNARG